MRHEGGFMSDKDGIAKNWEVVKDEFSDYRVQIAIVMDRVRRTEKWTRKLHHLSGLGPDIHRFMPRALWYSSVLAGVAGWVVVAYVIWG
jgi:hypothetical protein